MGCSHNWEASEQVGMVPSPQKPSNSRVCDGRVVGGGSRGDGKTIRDLAGREDRCLWQGGQTKIYKRRTFTRSDSSGVLHLSSETGNRLQTMCGEW